jgi:sigma-B regulation protein RsbU (phosphoserine phosphatase)
MKKNGQGLDERDYVKLERLELALGASNEGIWDWNTDESGIFYSQRVLEFLECGDKLAPNLFLAPYDSVFHQDRPAFKRAMSAALQDGGPETLAVDARIRTGGGDWRWMRIRGTVIRNREGKAVRIAGSMIDISRRKGAEAQVEEERFLLRQLIDHVPLKVYFKDLKSRFVMANQSTAEGMGCRDPEELAGKHDRDFFLEEHWKPAEADEKRIIQSGESVIDLLEHETWREAEETWVITSKFPWRDRHGLIKGTFGVSGDVTKLVTAQREASRLAQELQDKNQAYQEELLLAREIQQALAARVIPSANTGGLGRITFGARYIPISGMAGDFFEVIHVNEDCFGILICDVMGHGVRAALIVAMLRGMLERQLNATNEPSVFLHGLNDGLASILERAGTTMFATAFFGLIDLSSGVFKYACAGHPGPIIAGRGGVRQIASDRTEMGPGLGLIHDACYPASEIPLQEIDRIVLFTDGILEAENTRGEPFFENRLMEIIAANSEASLDSLLDGVLSSVLDFSEGRHFDDDVCLLGVELTDRS